MSSPFSLFSKGISAPVFQTPVSTGIARTSYTTPPTHNPMAYEWNQFQSNPSTSQPTVGGNPTFTYGNLGASPSNPHSGTFSASVWPKLSFLATLNLLELSKLMNDTVRHDPSWPPVPTKLPSDIPKFEGKVGEDPGAHATTFHLWCSSNSLNEDLVRLSMFQRTLTNTATNSTLSFLLLRSVIFGTWLVHSLATFSFRTDAIS